MLKTHGRYGYTPITRPNAARWPNGRGLAVYVALGVEEYDFGEGMTENILPGVPYPDLANTSWRDYGNRVGAFRILEVCSARDIPLTILLNTEVYDHAPDLMATLSAAGSEMVAHGLTNSDTLHGQNEADEAAYITKVRDEIGRREGKPPAGWSSPWLQQTGNTIDLLAEAGYRYVLDLGLDDRPVWLKARGGRLLHIPYALELNDSSTIVGRFASAEDFSRMIVDQFDELAAASEEQPLVMSVVVHSFITGQPFRLRAFRKALEYLASRREIAWFTTPERICESVGENPQLAV